MADILKMGFAGLSMDATKVLTQVAGLLNIRLAAAADAKRTAALAFYGVDDLRDACRRQTFVHFLHKILFDRVGVEMQH